jgi:hypothetical protein
MDSSFRWNDERRVRAHVIRRGRSEAGKVSAGSQIKVDSSFRWSDERMVRARATFVGEGVNGESKRGEQDQDGYLLSLE